LLGALVLVPLLYDGKQVLAFHEQPKQLALHVAGVIIVIAWAYELALSGDRWRSLSYLRSWFGRTPARWAIAAAGAFALAAVLSTVFSRTPRVSLWGQDFADLGYELYSILVLLVLFFAVAMRIRGRVQVQRIVYVFTVVGAISAAYGASQHFGWDPFGPGANVTRVWSTFLNQIFFGSFLVMSLFMTVSAALLASSNGRRWAALFSLLIGLQIAALWFAGGRGALFGAFIGGIVLIVVSVIRLDTDTLRRGARDLGGGLAVGVLLIAIPIGETRGTAPLVSAFIDTAQLSGVIASSDPEKDSQPTSNSSDARFSGRAGIWRGAVELIQSRDVYPPESGVSTILRQAFGFGPETYVYSFPLTAKSDGLRGADHAHNYPLQVLLEMGVIGLITLLALVGLILLTLVRLLWPGAGPRPDPWVGVVTIGVLAALVGRAIEQGSGVAQIGDLTGYWILMGLAVALSESAASVTERVGASGSRERTRRAGNQSGRKLATLAGAAIVIAVAGGVFLFMDIQQLRGSLAAVEANHLVAQNQGTKALEKYRDAIALAPDVSEYPLRLHALLTEVASRETDPAIRRSLLEIGYEVLADAADRDPYDFLLRERLALATLTLFEDGDTGRQDEVIDRYLDFAESRPNYSEAQALLGNSALIVGSYDLGLAAADRAIELETDPGALDRAWWVRGVALDELGNPLGAIDSFQQSITANDESQWAGLSHGRLVDLFESQGDIEQAAAHRASQAALQ
jgi:O-antigen ligase